MYSPQLGRFLSRDPLVEGQPDIFYDNNWFGDRLTAMRNLYGYANNNPVNHTDPSGLDWAGDLLGSWGIPQPCGSVTYKFTVGAASIAKREATSFGGCFGINNITLTVLITLGILSGQQQGVGSIPFGCVPCKCQKCFTVPYKKTVTIGPIDLRNYIGTGLPRNCKIWVSAPVDASATICVGLCI